MFRNILSKCRPVSASNNCLYIVSDQLFRLFRSVNNPLRYNFKKLVRPICQSSVQLVVSISIVRGRWPLPWFFSQNLWRQLKCGDATPLAGQIRGGGDETRCYGISRNRNCEVWRNVFANFCDIFYELNFANFEKLFCMKSFTTKYYAKHFYKLFFTLFSWKPIFENEHDWILFKQNDRFNWDAERIGGVWCLVWTVTSLFLSLLSVSLDLRPGQCITTMPSW